MCADTPLRGWVRQFDPVELDLLARRMRDDRHVSATGGPARFAVRTRLIPPQGPRENGIATRITEFDDLLEERRRPQVWVVAEPLAAVLQEGHERVRRLTPISRDPFAVQISADRLAIVAQMPGNRGDRPALTTQRVSIHVFLPGEHPGPSNRPNPSRTEAVRTKTGASRHAEEDHAIGGEIN
ncbi:hypothetical protein ACH492_39185 [Streptomyces sp. NPDC019443]|uniref:hypothetical protein n=1 Tax=Streptomyces sp. NPDC019443 TaxID=3365061 RepID=UPI0037B03BDE